MTFASVLERLQKVENPYPGLRPFETQESHLFFGRDQQTAELVDRLGRNRFVAVVGVSGGGKSSLVRAGLIPALERGHVADAGRRWRIVVTRPAGAPFRSLATNLAEAGLDASVLQQSSHGLIQVAGQLPPDESLLVVVDQFEELFRYKDQNPVTRDARREQEAAAGEAAEFVQLLLAASRHHPPIYIVLTMRSDYLGDCAEFRDLPETLNDCQYLVPRQTREQRKEAIVGPLGRTQIAPSLVQRVLNDAGDEPDQLPVLQHALMRTWSQWHKDDPEGSRRIELRDYEAIGGFEKALDQHGDELLAGVQESTAAVIFKRLTARGRSSRERRDPARLAELWALCGAETAEQRARVTAVVDRFRQGEATFLTPRVEQVRDLQAETYIDITHESLIRQWKKLRDIWLPAERESANTFLYLVQRAGRDKLTGLGLAEAMEWERRRNRTKAWSMHYADEQAIETVLEFIKESQKEEDKRAFQAKRNLWITGAAAVLFAAVGGAALYQWNEAGIRRDAAEKARKELVTKNAALEAFKERLLKQSGWPEDVIHKAQIDNRTFEEVLQANDQLQILGAPQKGVLIQYHPKDADWKESMDRLAAYWRSQGYKVAELPSFNAEGSNVMWLRGNIPPIDVKRIGLSLIRAGILLRGIDYLGSGIDKVEIGYDPTFYEHTAWTVAELVARQDFVSPRMVTDKQKAAYVLVSRPSKPDVVESIFSKAGIAGSRWDDRAGVKEMATPPMSAERAEAIRSQLSAAGVHAEIRKP